MARMEHPAPCGPCSSSHSRLISSPSALLFGIEIYFLNLPVEFTLLFGKIIIYLQLDKLVNCIWLETNISAPLLTPSLLRGLCPPIKAVLGGKRGKT